MSRIARVVAGVLPPMAARRCFDYGKDDLDVVSNLTQEINRSLQGFHKAERHMGLVSTLLFTTKPRSEGLDELRFQVFDAELHGALRQMHQLFSQPAPTRGFLPEEFYWEMGRFMNAARPP